jgi:hypothetical protein
MTPGRGPPQLGSMSIKELATIIVGANPGAPPEAIARAMTKAMPFLTAQDQQYWRQAEYELQRENLAERSRRDDMYMESIRQKPATAAATAAARQTPFQKAFAKFQEEHPEATAKELQDFANDPATQKLDAAQKRTETTAAGAKERVGMQQTGATERTGMQQAGAAARNAATNVSRENTARQSFEFKTDAFNRNYEQRDRQFAEKQTLARQKVEGGTPKEGDIENVAQGIANYRQAPYTGIAARSAAGLRVMDRVYQLNKGYDAANWRAHSDGITRFTSGVQGNTIRSLRVADDHLKTLSVLAAQLENGDARSFNAVKNFITKQMGYPEVTNLDTARQIVAAEVIKAVSATGGGVRERLEAAGQLDKTASLAQINGAIGTYRRLMAGQLRGFKAQYEQIPGNPKNFEEQFEFDPKMLSPEETSLGGAAPAKSGAKDQERGGTEGWSIQPIK